MVNGKPVYTRNHLPEITGVYIKFSRDKIDAANRRVIDWVVNGK